MTQSATRKRGPRDCKCGKGARGGRREGHERGHSGGENRIWWRASPQGTKYTGSRHASTSSARGGDHVVSVHSDLPSNC
eukprot:6212894-Pleurochrysis_carterae.AAC.4